MQGISSNLTKQARTTRVLRHTSDSRFRGKELTSFQEKWAKGRRDQPVVGAAAPAFAEAVHKMFLRTSLERVEGLGEIGLTAWWVNYCGLDCIKVLTSQFVHRRYQSYFTRCFPVCLRLMLIIRLLYQWLDVRILLLCRFIILHRSNSCPKVYWKKKQVFSAMSVININLKQ